VELAYDLSQLVAKCSGAHDEMEVGARMLQVGHVDLGAGRLGGAIHARICDDADNFHPSHGNKIHAAEDALAERILTGKGVAGESFVDDSHRFGRGGIAHSEYAASDERNTQCTEIIWRYHAEAGLRTAVLQSAHGLAGDDVASPGPGIGFPGQGSGERRRLYPGYIREAFEQRSKDPLVGLLRRGWNIDFSD